MINEIIDGICISLHNSFGEMYKIYTESVEQGFTKPCFSIENTSYKCKQYLGKRYYSETQFIINYFTDSKNYKEEFNTVREKIFEALEYIEVSGELVKGNKIYSEIKEDRLSFFINYNLFSYKEDVKEFMEIVGIKEGVKYE